MADLGSQLRVFHYRQALKSSEFNRIFSKTLPPGIYEGGTFTRVSGTEIRISPVSVIIEDSTEDSDIAVRIRTSTDVLLTLEMDPSRPIIALRYKWLPSEENYMEFIQVTEEIGVDITSRHEKDLILGKVLIEGGTIAPTNTFDYTRSQRTFANPQEDTIKNFFAVKTPIGVADRKRVLVNGGKLLTDDGLVIIPDTLSPEEITDTTGSGRWDYVYIDEKGSIKFQEGESSANPKTKPFFGRKVLAIIKRGPARTDIKGSDIESISTAERAEIKSTTILVKDKGTSEVFSKDTDGFITVDMALRELWGKSVAIENRATNLENTYVTKASNQDITGTKTFKALPKLLDNNNKPLVPSDGSHAINKLYYENTDTGTGAVRVGTNSSPIAQSIYGVKTFHHLPKVPTTVPTDGGEVVSKAFLDSGSSGVVHKTGDEIVGGTKIFSDIPKVSNVNHPNNAQQVITLGYYEDTTDGHGAVRVGNDTFSEAQDIYGTKTFKASPKIPTTPADKNSAINKEYLDSDDSSVLHRTGDEELSGIKTFKTLPRLTDGTNPLVPTVPSQAINKKFFDDNAVVHTGSVSQTITGTKTFSSSPKVPTTPADGNSAINKNYLDSSSSNVVHRTGTETINGSKTFGSEVTAPSFYASSSRKVKENISDVNISALEILNKTKIVHYSYISDPDSYIHTGFIAEDTPDILTGKDKNVMALSDVCGVLIKAIQELQEKMEREQWPLD